MSKRSIWLIVGVMTTALTGIFAMQMYSIYSSYQLNTELFDNNVHAALDRVASKLEQAEIRQTADLYNLPKLPSDLGAELSTTVEVEAMFSYKWYGFRPTKPKSRTPTAMSSYVV